MAMRSAISRVPRRRASPTVAVARRWFTDGKGRILSEEERAKENVYIQKMERERLEKLKKKAEKEKAEREKASAEKVKLDSKYSNPRILLLTDPIAFDWGISCWVKAVCFGFHLT
ncbi:hypothetical protein Taro_026873 [Colocasia esculenta]|uniref:Uncharacterized protein n=1 Tax=Colocasia esculenta TaxID=4460 RepID=A0A843VD21_COLES|nr:hypothetical protein [Colocasia esculenta]